MKTELKANEMEQVNGGNFFDDIKNVLGIIIPKPFDPKTPTKPIIPDQPIARGKC